MHATLRVIEVCAAGMVVSICKHVLISLGESQ